MILCNGIPKSGTHYLALCMELMGFPKVYEPREGPCCLMNHWTMDDKLPEHDHHFLIIRHPRNAMISMLRERERPLVPGVLISAIRAYPPAADRVSMVKFYDRFAGWLTDRDCVVVRYETMLSDGGETISKIARLTGGVAQDVYESAPSVQTATWTGSPSNWRDHWTPGVEKIWQENGCTALEETLGYG